MDLDASLSELGQFGWFQVYYFTQLLFPVLLTGFRLSEYVFTTMDIPHRCRIPGCDPEGPAPFSPPWLSHAVPLGEDNSPSACLRYGSTPGYNSSCVVDLSNNVTETCDSWVFEEPTITIGESFEILCPGDFWKLTLLSSISVFTGFVGEPLSGIISDRIGRKAVLVYGSIYVSIVGLLRSFSVNYAMSAILEGFDGLVCGVLFTPSFLLGLETLSPKKRLLGSMLINMYWPTGELVLACIMWLVHDWRNLLRVFYGPMLIISILLHWFLPESVRWLHTRGKKEEVVKVFQIIAKLNGSEDNLAKIVEQLEAESVETSDRRKPDASPKKGLRILSVFKSKIILCRLAVATLIWISSYFMYFSINQNAAYFGSNPYVAFILVILVEYPAMAAGLWVPDWPILGRKYSMFGTFLLAAVACLALLFVPEDQMVVNMILFLIGKGTCVLGCMSVYLYTAEIFPTELRNFLFSFCSTSNRFGIIASQQLPLLTPYVNPMLVISVVAFVGAALSLICPETLGTALPDTLEEAEAIGRGKAHTRS